MLNKYWLGTPNQTCQEQEQLNRSLFDLLGLYRIKHVPNTFTIRSPKLSGSLGFSRPSQRRHEVFFSRPQEATRDDSGSELSELSKLWNQVQQPYGVLRNPTESYSAPCGPRDTHKWNRNFGPDSWHLGADTHIKYSEVLALWRLLKVDLVDHQLISSGKPKDMRSWRTCSGQFTVMQLRIFCSTASSQHPLLLFQAAVLLRLWRETYSHAAQLRWQHEIKSPRRFTLWLELNV